MERKEQNKWEAWSSILHNHEVGGEGDCLADVDKKDFDAVKRIFDVKKKVRQTMTLDSTDVAWKRMKVQLLPRAQKFEYLKYAAVFLISLLVTSASFWGYNWNKFRLNEYAIITAPQGQISNITLFDGTNIWLNAGSTIKYNQSFNRNNREIFLDGEALFAVSKNEELPFIVHAGDAQIKVFGTEFDVKAYNNESYIETVLIEGRVEFTANEKAIKMSPGEHLQFSKKTGAIEKRRVQPEEYTAWKEGKIYFNNETLLNLTIQIERWYEVKFLFEDEDIQSYRFSGVINKDKSLEYILGIIQEINKVEFIFNKEQIIIKDKK